MRTVLKQQLLDMVNTLHQAHKEIEIYMSEKQYVSAKSLLSQCQECAISIGTTIEEFEETDCITVSYIENYCEFLYHIYKESEQNNTWNSRETYESLEGYLSTIENSIHNDILSKKEIVFLPYKVSMWDSLESVWKAAEEDPECDAYVIPIPYYDKNPDGTLRCEHYEGDAFPADVPITHYNNYDFKTRKPDAIFIHNPYDENNYVTTVHPFFYTAKLKEYCRKLIYIPYYVSAETSPDNYKAMEDRSGYVLSNGVLYSDMVFVQSENTKKLFVNILEKNISKINRNFWENKIFGLGSPKFDRINTTERDDTKLPENWKKIIYTDAGIRKKTIFYNISVSTLLNHSEILAKIRNTLNFFQNHTDIALWWRPHPLYESTLKSMRQDLLDEYKKIVQLYKKEAWGIFDDGVDLTWAIAETDAYYGDSSSVVNLYKELKKPVLIQNPQVNIPQKIEAKNIPIWPSVFCVDEDNVWFVHGKINILMRYNFSRKTTYLITLLSNKQTFKDGLYSGIYKWENKIFIIPCLARNIIVYDISNNHILAIDLKEIELYNHKPLFCKSYSKGNYLYCIPYFYKSIIKINMENCTLEYFEITGLLNKFFYSIESIYINDTTEIGDELISIIGESNILLVLNTVSDTMQIKRIEGKDNYVSISNIRNELYLFNQESCEIVALHNYTLKKPFIRLYFHDIKMNTINSNFIMVDDANSSAFQILSSNGEIIVDKKNIPRIYDSSLYSNYYNGIGYGDCYYFDNSHLLLYELDHGKIKNKYSFIICEEEFIKLKKQLCNVSDSEIMENEIFSLETWTKEILKSENILFKKPQNYGKKIWKKVKENLNSYYCI